MAQAMTEDERKRVRREAAALKDQHEVRIALLLGTGMRVGEAVHLHSWNIDFERRQILIPEKWPSQRFCEVKRDEHGALGFEDKYTDYRYKAGESWCECSDCRGKAKEAAELRVRNPHDHDMWERFTDVDEAYDELIRERWTPKTENGARRIEVLGEREWTVVSRWFKEHETLGCTRQSVGYSVRKLRDEVQTREKLTPHYFRHDWITRVASKVSSPQELMTIAGHGDITSSQKYIGFNKEQVESIFDSVREDWD